MLESDGVCNCVDYWLIFCKEQANKFKFNLDEVSTTTQKHSNFFSTRFTPADMLAIKTGPGRTKPTIMFPAQLRRPHEAILTLIQLCGRGSNGTLEPQIFCALPDAGT